MRYILSFFFCSIFFLPLTSFPVKAVVLESCMEEKCIVYFNKWKVMASAKRVLAMSTLAEFYYLGYGTEKDLKKSIKYFRRASRYQFSYAQYRAGLFYLLEEGFIDYQEGIKYLKKAARNGHIESAFLLGVIFGTGSLGIKDVGESDKWLAKALTAQHAFAQKYANHLYNIGEVNDGHYIKVNDFIRELNIGEAENEEGILAENSTEIQWPNDTEIEVISVSAPSLYEAFDYELNELKTAAPATNIATGTHIQGRTCSDIFSCEFVSKEDLWRLGWY